jgi:hypothetical protein
MSATDGTPKARRHLFHGHEAALISRKRPSSSVVIENATGLEWKYGTEIVG